MTEPPAASRPGALFADLAPAPENHFRIASLGAVLGVIEEAAASCASFEKAMERFPFLVGYNNELAHRLEGCASDAAAARWWAELEAWENDCREHLPLRALRTALRLDHSAVSAWLTVGLAEEDARFGAVFETLQGTPGLRRPTLGFLRHAGFTELGPLLRLLELGLVQTLNPDAPRADWQLQIPAAVWDALRHPQSLSGAAWCQYRPASELPDLDALTLDTELASSLRRLPTLVDARAVNTVVVRGPRHHGRRSVLGALARSLQRGLLEVRGLERADDERWRQVGALATLLPALPVVTLEPGPGETVALTELPPVEVPLGVVLGRWGGVSGSRMAQAAVLSVPLPDAAARRTHWGQSLPRLPAERGAELAERFRVGAGQIHRLAALAQTRAKLADRTEVTTADVLDAARSLGRETLDTLAQWVAPARGWDELCVSERTLRELRHFTSRCRHREGLAAALAGAPGGGSVGVRALFTGPSGTGKTLAARVLAAALEKDLFRVDLAAVVNKYIGETEKNLNRIFERAEDLDVLLLLDEGDALLTRRTEVSNANDRYANLETNFLLQRLESFQGILIVTTNAGERIDSAFQRRMDLVVEFHAPGVAERRQLWQRHLPARCNVDEQLLGELASRCELTGGQIRNAAQHAVLLALDNGGVVSAAYLEAAVRREYLKGGASCPLRGSGEN
jgi:hypothetical protein